MIVSIIAFLIAFFLAMWATRFVKARAA